MTRSRQNKVVNMEQKQTMKVEAHEHQWQTYKVAWDTERDTLYVLLECADDSCGHTWTRELDADEPN